ncbi:MAG: FlaA1/EpsC-like NDP-sugar epimerase [Lentimonas sp.]
MGLVKSGISFKEFAAAKSGNMFILNTHRQIVFITRSVLDLFNIEDPAEVYGCRPGEMMRCELAHHDGCGVSEECQLCGANQAANDCLKRNSAAHPFELLQKDSEEAIPFTVHAEAITLSGQLFMMISLIKK